ncbi:MarR family transcriptional regulator [Corynebacterium hylobatis]|uniref:MarR family transcriptional regulator n=1 Tax=Corynebacterium hylobatis TaxID=1859290 RepID=A0A430HZY2_9CORY|nr:MarR family winged helix-turn-helix transcriptional regulator [Corynebacterium hylobatis]RSZ63927.1 MarR family transcriptional regulator [Corynebacterium hylobatis]
MDDHPDDLVYEYMLMSRYAVTGTHPDGRRDALERSAMILLARLVAEGPMTVAELADAFDLDVSTIHRQVAAAMKNGLILRIDDPDGGAARRHRPTAEGRRRYEEELAARRTYVDRVVADWSAEDRHTFTAYLRRFNEDMEGMLNRPWPRGGTDKQA